MIGGIMLTVAGTIYSENQRGTYVKFMSQTHDANIIRSYQTKVNQFATVRNICIGGIAALYLWNVVDALVSPGASHVKTNSERLSISPVAYNSAGIGLSATYSF